MSLSDTDSDQFEPIAVSSLEVFDKEYSNRAEDTKPDFYRFKALFEKPEFGEKESDEFKVLYDDNQEEEETVFQPLIDPWEDMPEKKGYRQRFEKCLEQGVKKKSD